MDTQWVLAVVAHCIYRGLCLICTLLGYRILGGSHIYLMNFFYYLSFNRQDIFLAAVNFARETILKENSYSQYELLSLSSPPVLVTPLSVWCLKRRPSSRDFFSCGNVVWSCGQLSSFLYITDLVWFPDEKCTRPRCQETMKPYFSYEEKSASCIC